MLQKSPYGVKKMDINYLKIQELLQQRAEISAKLNLIPYSGSIEIKESNGQKYIYLRKKVLGKNTSIYIDKYSEALFLTITKLLSDVKQYNKQIRVINSQLARLGYSDYELSPRVMLNIDFARANLKSNIYDQAILEGIATTFPDTETILDNGKVTGMTVSDIQKILNLKHAWEFILDKDVICSPVNYSVLCHIAGLVNEGFYIYGGRIRSVPVTIGGTDYVPIIPIESDVKQNIIDIINQDKQAIDVAIELCLYCMKTQIFNDGNKRAAVIFANHYLISKGEGLIIIPQNKVPEFKKLLINYYEDKDVEQIKQFMKKFCWKSF